MEGTALRICVQEEKMLHVKKRSNLIEGMEQQVNKERWDFMWLVVANGPGLSKTEVLQQAGLSAPIAWKGYRSTLQPETCRRVIQAVAQRLVVDEAQLSAWLSGKREPSVQQHLETLLQHVQCNGPACGGLFAPAQMVRRSGLCRRCFRLKARPDIEAWENLVAEMMATCSDPDLVRGWGAVTSDRQNAVTHSAMAEAAGLSITEWMKRWKAADLPQKKLRNGKDCAGGQGDKKFHNGSCGTGSTRFLRHRRAGLFTAPSLFACTSIQAYPGSSLALGAA